MSTCIEAIYTYIYIYIYIYIHIYIYIIYTHRVTYTQLGCQSELIRSDPKSNSFYTVSDPNDLTHPRSVESHQRFPHVSLAESKPGTEFWNLGWNTAVGKVGLILDDNSLCSFSWIKTYRLKQPQKDKQVEKLGLSGVNLGEHDITVAQRSDGSPSSSPVPRCLKEALLLHPSPAASYVWSLGDGPAGRAIQYFVEHIHTYIHIHIYIYTVLIHTYIYIYNIL